MLSSYFFIEQAVNQNKMGKFYYPIGKEGWSSFTSQTGEKRLNFPDSKFIFSNTVSIDITQPD